MTELPARLEFGNLDHIKTVKAWEKERLVKFILEEKKDWLLHTQWKFHDHYCDACGSNVAHDEDPEIEIEHIRQDEVEVKLICRGRECDEVRRVVIPLDF